MSTLEQTSVREAPENTGLALPAWLDGRTIALLTTGVTATLTLGAMTLTLGTMMQTAHSRLASDIDQLRRDLDTNIGEVRVELKAVRDELKTDLGNVRDELKTDIGNVRNELGTDVAKLDDRLRSVEVDVAAIRMTTTGFDARGRTVEELAREPVPPPRTR